MAISQSNGNITVTPNSDGSADTIASIRNNNGVTLNLFRQGDITATDTEAFRFIVANSLTINANAILHLYNFDLRLIGAVRPAPLNNSGTLIIGRVVNWVTPYNPNTAGTFENATTMLARTRDQWNTTKPATEGRATISCTRISTHPAQSHSQGSLFNGGGSARLLMVGANFYGRAPFGNQNTTNGDLNIYKSFISLGANLSGSGLETQFRTAKSTSWFIDMTLSDCGFNILARPILLSGLILNNASAIEQQGNADGDRELVFEGGIIPIGSRPADLLTTDATRGGSRKGDYHILLNPTFLQPAIGYRSEVQIGTVVQLTDIKFDIKNLSNAFVPTGKVWLSDSNSGNRTPSVASDDAGTLLHHFNKTLNYNYTLNGALITDQMFSAVFNAPRSRVNSSNMQTSTVVWDDRLPISGTIRSYNYLYRDVSITSLTVAITFSFALLDDESVTSTETQARALTDITTLENLRDVIKIYEIDNNVDILTVNGKILEFATDISTVNVVNTGTNLITLTGTGTNKTLTIRASSFTKTDKYDAIKMLHETASALDGVFTPHWGDISNVDFLYDTGIYENIILKTNIAIRENQLLFQDTQHRTLHSTLGATSSTTINIKKLKASNIDLDIDPFNYVRQSNLYTTQNTYNLTFVLVGSTITPESNIRNYFTDGSMSFSLANRRLTIAGDRLSTANLIGASEYILQQNQSITEDVLYENLGTNRLRLLFNIEITRTIPSNNISFLDLTSAYTFTGTTPSFSFSDSAGVSVILRTNFATGKVWDGTSESTVTGSSVGFKFAANTSRTFNLRSLGYRNGSVTVNSGVAGIEQQVNLERVNKADGSASYSGNSKLSYVALKSGDSNIVQISNTTNVTTALLNQFRDSFFHLSYDSPFALNSNLIGRFNSGTSTHNNWLINSNSQGTTIGTVTPTPTNPALGNLYSIWVDRGATSNLGVVFTFLYLPAPKNTTGAVELAIRNVMGLSNLNNLGIHLCWTESGSTQSCIISMRISNVTSFGRLQMSGRFNLDQFQRIRGGDPNGAILRNQDFTWDLVNMDSSGNKVGLSFFESIQGTNIEYNILHNDNAIILPSGITLEHIGNTKKPIEFPILDNTLDTYQNLAQGLGILYDYQQQNFILPSDIGGASITDTDITNIKNAVVRADLSSENTTNTLGKIIKDAEDNADKAARYSSLNI